MTSKKLEQTTMEFPDPDKGYICPCCSQFVKRYHRKMNANMCVTLCLLVRKKRSGFVPIEEFMRVMGHQRSGDFSYLVHWGLLEKMTGKRPDGSSKNGFYKITDKGVRFVKGEITVPQTLIIYNGKCEGFEGMQVDIKYGLGKRFDYAELMKGDYTIQKS